jgi:hypothetical protein
MGYFENDYNYSLQKIVYYSFLLDLNLIGNMCIKIPNNGNLMLTLHL